MMPTSQTYLTGCIVCCKGGAALGIDEITVDAAPFGECARINYRVQDAVFELADRLTVMQDGRVIASGAPQQVRAHPAVRSAYLGTHGDAA